MTFDPDINLHQLPLSSDHFLDVQYSCLYTLKHSDPVRMHVIVGLPHGHCTIQCKNSYVMMSVPVSDVAFNVYIFLFSLNEL